MHPLSTMDEATLEDLVASLGAPRFRAAQLRRAAWQPLAAGFDDVSVLPAPLRARLAAEVAFSTVEVTDSSEADGGLTVKLLCRLADGQTIETVAMESPVAGARRRRRATVCVSSQVGCAVGCPFCATAQMGLRRQCTAAEIVDQVRVASRVLAERGLGPVTHVVYMGMGEPLANYDNVVTSLRVLTGPGGLSARHLTVSTSGVVPSIDRLAAEGLPVTLAISLHAAENTLRDRLVPLNRAHPLDTLVDAGVRYHQATGRRVSYEWCLIGGVNDSVEEAERLRDLAFRAQAHVNVIPMNHVDGSPWGPPGDAQRDAFMRALRGVSHTVRDTRGSTTDAACGQLRAGLERRRVVQADGTLSPPRRLPLTPVPPLPPATPRVPAAPPR